MSRTSHMDRVPCLLLLLAAVASASCTPEQPDVVRVQTNLVEKAVFEGEWWYSATAVDVQYDEAYVFDSANAFAPFDGSMSSDFGLDFNRGGDRVIGSPGYSFPIAKIRWVIDQDYLFAFRSYELVSGGNDGGSSPDFRGQPLAVYAIEDHVDLRQQYNAVTGESLNVQYEDTADRRWYDRAYVRVDWSENLLTEFSANDVEANELFNGFSRESTPLFFQEGGEESYPDSYKPQFIRVEDESDYRFLQEWPQEERDRVHYMSFVTQEVWSPGDGCLLTGGGTCASVTATLRNSFLRVPPQHEYASTTLTHREFDRFGIFRAHQPTYARGGADREVQATHCRSDEDCGQGGACDNLQRVLDECDGEQCREPRYLCVGGLTGDYGETDFLSFFASRHNFYSDSLTDRSCLSDWQCNGLHACDLALEILERCASQAGADCQPEQTALDDCGAGSSDPHGSVCDLAARRCTVPLRQRTMRPVSYRLSKHFPPYLVRDAFASVAQWNEVLMRGRRAAQGRTEMDEITGRTWALDPIFQDLRADPDFPRNGVVCSDPAGEACEVQTVELNVCATQGGDPQERCAAQLDAVQGCLCRVDLSATGRMECQMGDPTGYCYCGSPEEVEGSCVHRYDPFETPQQARARGVINPYDCHIEGPDDVERPEAFEEYGAEVYEYRFVGTECMLTAVANSCDLDPEVPCEELGDLRHHFMAHVQHGSAGFGGVAQPLSDPQNGELVVSNATVAGESLERIGTTASQFFPVLRGEVSEESYFSGENVRGYYANLGRVDRPASVAPTVGDGYAVDDPSRPTGSAETDDPGADIFQELAARMKALEPKMEQLRGNEGRAAILSDRVLRLKGTPLESRAANAVLADADPASSDRAQELGLDALDEPIRQQRDERQRRQLMASRNMDTWDEAIFNSQYFRYWADAFEGRSEQQSALRMQQALFRAIMLHEIGHAMGLRHNFAGSLDRDNYQDGYFNLSRRQPLPAYSSYDRPERGGNLNGAVTGDEAQLWSQDLRDARQARLESGAGNVMTSSVMDYNGDLSDFSGLGRYDKAAVLFAYFDRIETYDTPDPTRDPSRPAPDDNAEPTSVDTLQWADSHRRLLWTYYRGGEICQQNIDCPHASGRETTAFQLITQRCVSNPRDDGPSTECRGGENCTCSNYYDDFQAYEAADAYRSMGDDRRFTPVEYLFCHDNRVDDLSWCTQFDAGESFQEVVDHYRMSWVQRYPQLYFRNYKLAGPQRGAAENRMQDAVKIFQHLYFRYNWEGADFVDGSGPLAFRDQLFASAEVLDWLTEIIGAPDVGSYAYDSDDHVYRQISSEPDAPGADLSLPLGQGFHLWSSYQEGLNGFNRLERAGTMLDKYLAIRFIAERDWGLRFTVDERYYINFYDLFEREVVDLFGGLIMRNPAAYAPRIAEGSDGSRVQYLSTYRSSGRGNNESTYPEPAIDGVDSEVLRDLATIFALANFPVFYDTSFEQRLLVFKLGSGDGYDIPAQRGDGTPTCGFGDAGCAEPDFIVYDSDRLHTSYVAVTVNPDGDAVIDEQQLGFQILRALRARQDRIRSMAGRTDLTSAEDEQLSGLHREQERDEGYLEYLIDLERSYGISTYLY